MVDAETVLEDFVMAKQTAPQFSKTTSGKKTWACLMTNVLQSASVLMEHPTRVQQMVSKISCRNPCQKNG